MFGYNRLAAPSTSDQAFFDVVAESEIREVFKSLVSNIWLHHVSSMRL